MQFSVASAYGLQVMIKLAEAQKQTGQLLSLAELTDAHYFSTDYMERVLRQLRSAGLVKSGRGRYGGYALSKEAKLITVKDIFEALETDLYPYKCQATKCSANACLAKTVWDTVYQAIDKSLQSLTLGSLVRKKINHK
jgi:Rrf2 family iron-sulfur cluster assembly transcriptional regulator